MFEELCDCLLLVRDRANHKRRLQADHAFGIERPAIANARKVRDFGRDIGAPFGYADKKVSCSQSNEDGCCARRERNDASLIADWNVLKRSWRSHPQDPVSSNAVRRR
jgi:hypothetical protein